MPYTALCKNQMLAAIKGTNPTTPITHVGAMTASTKALTTPFGVASTDTFTSSSWGSVANGTPVLVTALGGGGAGLVTGDAGNANEQARVYFVINTAATTFQLANTPGGAAVDFTSDITGSGTIIILTEISGGSPAYARKAIAYNAPVDGSMDDSTNGAVIDIPAGGVVDYISYHSASTAGTLLAVDKVTQETFGAQGTYTLTDSDLDLNQGA